MLRTANIISVPTRLRTCVGNTCVRATWSIRWNATIAVSQMPSCAAWLSMICSGSFGAVSVMPEEAELSGIPLAQQSRHDRVADMRIGGGRHGMDLEHVDVVQAQPFQ